MPVKYENRKWLFSCCSWCDQVRKTDCSRCAEGFGSETGDVLKSVIDWQSSRECDPQSGKSYIYSKQILFGAFSHGKVDRVNENIEEFV